MEVDKNGTKRTIGGGKGNRTGTPQGGVICFGQYQPAGQDMGAADPQRLGARIVRYADDIVVLCKRGTEKPLSVLSQVLKFSLNEIKTRIVDAHRTFLGFAYGWEGAGDRGTGHPAIEEIPADSRTDRLTQRQRTIIWVLNELIPARMGRVLVIAALPCEKFDGTWKSGCVPIVSGTKSGKGYKGISGSKAR